MISRARILWLLWPALLCLVSVLMYAFHAYLFPKFMPQADPQAMLRVSAVAAFYSFAWLAARIADIALARKGKAKRRKPKLLGDLVTATLFALATVAAIGLLLGQSAGGILASSGLIIAILGFAIRNVLADVLSGIAIGLEAPFRIGDWVEFDETTTGRVIEIGWRTTRVLTPNDTYMILPNSQISRLMLTNYSAPRKHYQASVQIVLHHDIPVSQGKQLLFEAAMSASAMPPAMAKEAVVRASVYDVEGVTYTVKYWVPTFSRDIDCRDAVLMAIDEALRERGWIPPRATGQRQLTLHENS